MSSELGNAKHPIHYTSMEVHMLVGLQATPALVATAPPQPQRASVAEQFAHGLQVVNPVAYGFDRHHDRRAEEQACEAP